MSICRRGRFGTFGNKEIASFRSRSVDNLIVPDGPVHIVESVESDPSTLFKAELAFDERLTDASIGNVTGGDDSDRFRGIVCKNKNLVFHDRGSGRIFHCYLLMLVYGPEQNRLK